MPPTPSTLATVMFTAGAVVPFVVLIVCFVLGLVRR